MATGSSKQKTYVFVNGRAVEVSPSEGPIEQRPKLARAPWKKAGKAPEERAVQRPADAARAKEAGDGADAQALQSDVALQHPGDVPPQVTMQIYEDDKRSMRRRTGAFAAVLVLVAIASLHLSISWIGVVYSPADVIGCLASWFKLNIGAIFVPSIALEQGAIVDAYPMYYQVTARAAHTFIAIVCGMMLAISGMLYQNVFRNPIAAPTMLGVSNGISIGQVLLVLVYGTAAASMTMVGMRYVYSFVGGIVVLAIVILGGIFIGGKRSINLVDMLLVGTIISSLLGTVINYIVNYVFTDAQWEAYYDLNNSLQIDTSPASLVFLAVAAVVTLIPVVLFRFRMNCISFSDEDMRLFGINPAGLRIVALLSGSLMILTAQTYMGTVSMVSLVVPFIMRAAFGAEFRKQLLGNAFAGAILLLVCDLITSLIPFVGDGVPLGTVVSIVTLPAFAWIMALAQKQWNDK